MTQTTMGKPTVYGSAEMARAVQLWLAEDINPLSKIDCYKFKSERFDGERYAFGITEYCTGALIFESNTTYATRAEAITAIGRALDEAAL